MGVAMNLLGRATLRVGSEARFAATLLKARGPGVALIPPHRMLSVARALDAYGPAGAAIVFAASTQPDAVAICDERGTITFAEVDERSNALANALLDRGYQPGQSLGILARNHRGIFEAIFAAAKIGARTLLLNTDFAGPQLADVCAREEVVILVHDDEFTSVVAGYHPPLGRVLAWTDAEPTDGTATIDGLVDTSRSAPPPRPGCKQRIVLLTSGTTGTPKGAPRDLALSMAIPGGYLSKIPLRSGRSVLLAAPAFHAWGLLSSMLALGLGNTLVTSRRFDPKFTIAALEHHRCDALITVPVLLARLLAVGEPEIAAHDLSALRVIAVSGSALAPELATRTMDLLGDIVYNLYGSTEVAYATIATPEDAPLAVFGSAVSDAVRRLLEEQRVDRIRLMDELTLDHFQQRMTDGDAEAFKLWMKGRNFNKIDTSAIGPLDSEDIIARQVDHRLWLLEQDDAAFQRQQTHRMNFGADPVAPDRFRLQEVVERELRAENGCEPVPEDEEPD